jgi:Cu2+-exporting ATPase
MHAEIEEETPGMCPECGMRLVPGTGDEVAAECCHCRNDPRDVVNIITLSRVTYAKMLQNLFWATGYNIIALPLAAGVLASYGVILQPALAALFMSLSTVIVAVNALLLRRQKIP